VVAQPNGFLMAMVPKDGVSNHIYPYAIDPKTGVASVLGDGDYIMASLQNTQNSGTFNVAAKKVHFIGQSLTMSTDTFGRSGPQPNPTMNFFISIDATGDYTSNRLLTTGGLVYTVRADDSGKIWGMEQFTPTQDARIDVVEDTGLCDNFINTTAKKGYLVGHAAVNSAANLFYVSVKNDSGAISLLTADLKAGGLIDSADLSNPSWTRLTLCYDGTTRTLVSLERPASGDSQLVAVDPHTGRSTPIVSFAGRATQGDCRGGFFFASGTAGSDAWLSVVDIAAAKIVRTIAKLSVPAPTLLVFFPQ